MRQLLFFVLFLGLLASFGNQGWYRLLKLKTLAESLERENQSLALENEALKQSIADLKDPRHLERYIRHELGFIRDNELLYEWSGDEK